MAKVDFLIMGLLALTVAYFSHDSLMMTGQNYYNAQHDNGHNKGYKEGWVLVVN